MSKQFAQLMIAELNTRISLLDSIIDEQAVIALCEYRDAIASIMSSMGHKLVEEENEHC